MLPFQNPELPVPARVRDLIDRLTLEEKAAQMLHEAPAIERLAIPAYNWWNECLHGVARQGVATVFPQAIGMAATWSRETLTQVGNTIALEARAKHHEYLRQNDHGMYKGLTYWTPNINIFRDPRWGRGHETYGECPYLTARLGVALCSALQGDDPNYFKVIATPKHFAVHSGPEADRHSFDAVVSQKDLWETYLPAFHACVTEAQAYSVMGAYNRVNGEPCCGSPTLLTDILREKWGFQGYVVSDCWALKDFHENHGVTRTPEESAALAVKMGCDLNCGCTYEHIPAAVRQGLLAEADLDVCLTRLFTARMRLGMFDPPERVPFASIPYEVNDCPEHHAIALDTARKSIVLLKNANNLLPLPADIPSIAVIGPNANDDQVLLANYFGQPSVSTTPLEGIRAAVSAQTKVWTTPGCKRTGMKTDGVRNHGNLSEAVSMAQRATVTVLCLGLSAELEGEQDDIGATDVGGDKSDLKLTGLQQRLMEEIVALGKPVVLVLMAGSPMDISWAQEHVGAILDVWYPGPFGGTALADVLFGKVSPAGRLPVTFPKAIADVPAFANYDMTGRTYRFSSKTPLYPFGYGLSYAAFTYDNLTSSTLEVSPSSAATVRVRVTNTSQRDSDEVVQLYVEHVTRGAERAPLRELRGFERVHVRAGESRDVEFTVTAKDLSVIDDQGRRQLRPGKFRLHVGGSQPDARSVALTGKSPLHLDVSYGGKAVELPY